MTITQGELERWKGLHIKRMAIPQAVCAECVAEPWPCPPARLMEIIEQEQALLKQCRAELAALNFYDRPIVTALIARLDERLEPTR